MVYWYCRYGVVLKELGSRSEAREAQLNSLSLQPLFWGAWSELAILCDSREMVSRGEGGEERERGYPHVMLEGTLPSL